MSRVSERLALSIFRRFPARPQDLIFKEAAGRAEDEYADEGGRGFFWYFGQGPEMFAGKDVLDLGCGFGGRTVRFLEYGARTVTGLEITPDHVRLGEEFAARHGHSDVATFVHGTGEDIPCADESFDLVAMLDVMEHVVSPRDVLSESWRVLRPGGRLAVVFPPYYDLTGGSHLHGYATRFPGINLLFSTKTLRGAARRLLDEQGVDHARYFRDVPSDRMWNQNGLTVRGFRRVVRESRFEPEFVRYAGHMEMRVQGWAGPANFSRIPAFAVAQLAAQIPGLQELFCVRICAILRK